MRALYLHCHSGVSGDMLLGALVDLGAPLAVLNDAIAELGIDGLSLSARSVDKSGIAACKVDVHIETEIKLKHYSEARTVLKESGLNDSLKRHSLATLRALAAAEARIHSAEIETVHFHELGSLDTIADVVGVFAALEYLEIDSVRCSPIAVGGGVVEIDHGVVPNPAPATLELLRGLPLDRSDLSGERATPTGAAIIRTLLESQGSPSSSPGMSQQADQPRLVLRNIGYGAGSADFSDRINVLRAELSETDESEKSAGGRDQIIQIETTIDDMNPQLYGHLFERLYAAGALEVFAVAVMMKKTRPGQNLVVLAPEDKLAALSEIILTETTSAGVRYQRPERIIADRELSEIKTPYGEVVVKRIRFNGITRWQPEYDSCLALAKAINLPLGEIMQAAQRAAVELAAEQTH